jgi:peptidyl-prolyl cis-trans isomerase SurA
MLEGVVMKRFAVAIALTIAVSVPAVAQKVISQIAAKVNKDIILASELKRAEEDIHSELVEQQKLKGPQLQQAMEARSKDILRDLIDKYLILQEAADLGLDANLEVLKQIEQLRIDNNFPTLEAMEAAMIRQGISIDEVKDSIRYRNLRSQVLHHEVTGKIVITTEESRAYYEAHKKDFDRPPGVALGMIRVSIDGLSPAEIEAKNKTMADAQAALKKGDEFGEVARKYSEDPTGQDGGNLGFFERDDNGNYGLASPEMEETVKKMTKGQTTDIISNPETHSLMILKLLDKHDGGVLSFETAQTEIFNILMDERAEPKVRAYLTRLRAQGYVEVYPGFTDTGAATKPIRASDTAPPKEK